MSEKIINMKNIFVLEKDDETGEVVSCKSMYELLLDAIEKLGWDKVIKKDF